MIHYFRKPREHRPSNAVIVFEPVAVRAGAMWRAVKFARAALLIWGAVSLAGAAAAAVAYGRGGLEPYLQAGADAPASAAVALAPSKPAPEPPSRPAPVRQVLPTSAAQPAVVSATPPGPVVNAPAARANPPPSPARPASPPEARAPALDGTAPAARAPFSAARPPLTPYDDPEEDLADIPSNTETLAADGFQPLVVARLPRARPDEPLTTGSIDRHYEPQSLRRFRRLREMRARYRVDDRYMPIPHYRDFRRLHPYFRR